MNPEDYELGEEVTNIARPLGRPSGVVLSIRVDQDMLVHLERIATIEDRTISAIARRALKEWLLQQERPQVVMLTEMPPWLTGCSGNGHNFFMPFTNTGSATSP